MNAYLSTTLPSDNTDIIVYYDRDSGKITEITDSNKNPFEPSDEADVIALRRQVLAELDAA